MYIVYGDDWESKLLHKELTRDWSTPGPAALHVLGKNPPASALLAILDGKRASVNEHIKLIHKNSDVRFLRAETPIYRFGEYGDFSKFDTRSFVESSYPLKTVEALIRNHYADMKYWRYECNEILELAEIDYATQIHMWASENHTVEFFAFNAVYFGVEKQFEMPRHERLIREFGRLPDMPEWVPPLLPECPELPFPWENQNPNEPTLLPGEH